MGEILKNVINTATVTGSVDVRENETIYPSDESMIMAEKIYDRFKVGDFVVVEGTEAYEFKKAREINAFPEWMELRIRCNELGLFVIFYPKGMLTFTYLCARCSFSKLEKKQFKCEILHGDKLGYKIWRSK